MRLRLFNRCQHLHTRCLHGDEITALMKVYIFRFWKDEVVYRQICLNCGKALNRIAICTARNRNWHEWYGEWPYD